jgi:hypothetical protein
MLWFLFRILRIPGALMPKVDMATAAPTIKRGNFSYPRRLLDNRRASVERERGMNSGLRF